MWLDESPTAVLPTTIPVLLGGFNANFGGSLHYQASTAHGIIELLAAPTPTPPPTMTPTPTTRSGMALPVTGGNAVAWLSLALLLLLSGLALLAGGRGAAEEEEEWGLALGPQGP